MSTNVAVNQNTKGPNGVDVGRVMEIIDNTTENPAYAEMQFRTTNNWLDGGLNRSSFKGFYGGLEENTDRTEAFVVDADEPAFIGGEDSVPNPVEFVLHALAGCLTTSLVYHAAVRDIEIGAVESNLEGDIDVRGLLGMDENVRKGYHHVRVNMRVKSEASAEELTELALFSPVHDMISRSGPVEFNLETY
jgi:uncharacterized OsmC-like protein